MKKQVAEAIEMRSFFSDLAGAAFQPRYRRGQMPLPQRNRQPRLSSDLIATARL
jgi:hypothetical protein